MKKLVLFVLLTMLTVPVSGQKKTFKINPVKTPEAIDLGLPSGVLWGSFNLGATKPEDEGNKYAWGETKAKSSFILSNYSYFTPYKVTVTGGGKDADGFAIPVKKVETPAKYLSLGEDISGTEYDAARANLGEEWRMPSYDDFLELLNYCELQHTTKNDVEGVKLTGPNGNWIFFPDVECQVSDTYFYHGVYYWTSTRFTNDPFAKIFEGKNIQKERAVIGEPLILDFGYRMSRESGLAIRPIYAKQDLIDARKVFTKVDELPVFPGGENEMFLFLNRNFRYPENDYSKVHNTFNLAFIVEVDGSITKLSVTDAPNYYFAKEAIRMFKLMPKWKPGQKDGKVVRTKVRLRFKLLEDRTLSHIEFF